MGRFVCFRIVETSHKLLLNGEKLNPIFVFVSLSPQQLIQLKSGAFATVCKGKHRQTGKQYAIKCITRNALKPWEEIDILNEVCIMSTLVHPNIVLLVDFFVQNDCYLIVMELCEGGDVFDRIGKRVDCQGGHDSKTRGYTERDARDLCKALLEAVRYCHEDMSIAHCDLKPRNLLLQVSTTEQGMDGVM